MVIKSPDTDVFVIGVTKAQEIGAEILFDTGKGDNRHTIMLGRVRVMPSLAFTALQDAIR